MNPLARLALASLFLTAGLALPAAAQQCCTGSVASYCTAGTSVQGCVPQIDGIGRPRMDDASGFDIRVSSLPGQRTSMLFYGFAPLSLPWAPGSSSFVCINSPLQRMVLQSSGGAAGACNGAIALDFNAWSASHPAGLGMPFAPGQVVRTQCWYRDPGAAGQVNLSNALVFTLCSGPADTTPPVITNCPPNASVAASTSCQAVVPDLSVGVVATDNCTPPTFTQSPAVGTIIGLGVTPVTITATDASGNTAQCVRLYTVSDTTAPAISNCAPTKIVTANSNCQGVVPDYRPHIVAVDGCGGVVTLTQNPAPGTLLNPGVSWLKVTIDVSDVSGNTAQCSAMLFVTQPPSCITPSTLVAIQPGTFLMGDPSHPALQHPVTLTYPFWIGDKEVTQREYVALMGTNPSFFHSSDEQPVHRLSWQDARDYCALLTLQQAASIPSGYEYRLPTEAEWERACRSGTTTAFNFSSTVTPGCNDLNFKPSFPACVGQPVPVGSYPTSPWGLHDMHGNVAEWCLDSYESYIGYATIDPFITGGATRVVRGGAYLDSGMFCVSSARRDITPTLTPNYIGFRVVLGPILVP